MPTPVKGKVTIATRFSEIDKACKRLNAEYKKIETQRKGSKVKAIDIGRKLTLQMQLVRIVMEANGF